MTDDKYNEVMALLKSTNTNRTKDTFEDRKNKNYAKVREYDEKVYWPEMHKMGKICEGYGHKEGGVVCGDKETCKCCGLFTGRTIKV